MKQNPNPDQTPNLFGRITRISTPSTQLPRNGFVGTMPIPPNADKKWATAYIRQFHGAGTYTVDVMQKHPDKKEYPTCIFTWSNIKIAPEDLKGNDYGKIPEKKPHIMLPPAEKIALNPETKPKKTRKKKQPKKEPEIDVFAAVIRGGLFKKDIEEP